MTRYFAQIENEIVKQVIVADSKEWCEEFLGGEWVETYQDTKKNFAGIGFNYHRNSDNFYPKKPYESWVLDEKLDWQPQKEKKTKLDKEDREVWNEDILDWEIIKKTN